MPLGEVIELYSYRTRSLRDGVPTLTRAFNVEGLTPDVALQVPNIPGYRDPHPDDPTLIARDISASPRGAGSLIQATYTPAPYVGGSGPGVNTFEEGFIGKDASFDYEDVELPLFRVVDYVYSENGTATEKAVFEAVDTVVPFRKRVPYHRISLGITFPDAPTLQDVLGLTDLVLSQVDKLHVLPDGKEYVFACEGIDQGSKVTDFNITYRWTRDPGVPNELESSFGPSAGPNLRFLESAVYPVFDSDFLIPPYKGLRIDGNRDPEQPPTVTFFDRYKREPNGWQNLPGIA